MERSERPYSPKAFCLSGAHTVRSGPAYERQCVRRGWPLKKGEGILWEGPRAPGLKKRPRLPTLSLGSTLRLRSLRRAHCKQGDASHHIAISRGTDVKL